MWIGKATNAPSTLNQVFESGSSLNAIDKRIPPTCVLRFDENILIRFVLLLVRIGASESCGGENGMLSHSLCCRFDTVMYARFHRSL